MNLSAFVSNLELDVDWLGVREVCQKSTIFTARDGKSDRYAHHVDRGWMVEVLVNGQFAAVATNTATPDALKAAAVKAKSIAEQASRHSLHPFHTTVRPPSRGTYASPPSPIPSLKELSEILIQTSHDLKVDDCIISTSVTGIIEHTQSQLFSTAGGAIDQNITRFGLLLSATAQIGSDSQTRTNGSVFSQNGVGLFDAESLKKQALQIGSEAVELIKAEECPTGTFDVVLTPDQVYLQIHESIGHPLELDRILGDERNYAGWSFIKPEDFGQLQYGSPLLNITFDPTMSDELASYAFDDLGAPAQHQYLIKNGLLVGGLGSLESQQRLKVPGVASARASSWNRLPIDRMANVNMEPGTTSIEDMIDQIDDGILMMTNKSWSIDDYRRKFQFGCEYGRRIQKGRLTHVVKNPNYRGITLPFWQKLKAVGDQNSLKAWGSFFCGKGEPNQIAAVGHATPACWFEGLDVFGGG